MAKRKNEFGTSLVVNSMSFMNYYEELLNIAVSSIRWEGLPPEVDERYLEYTLCVGGFALFYKDEFADRYVALRCTIGAPLNIYDVPTTRRAYASNGYQYEAEADKSVIIFNNYLHTSMVPRLQYYARRLYDLDRTIDINARTQKTPLLLSCDDDDRLTILNLYKKYDGNEPVITGTTNIKADAIKAIQTGAPYVGDKLYDLRMNIMNEALCYIGINNMADHKKERMSLDEVNITNGFVYANREARLAMRQQAAREIKDKFGLELNPVYNTDLELSQGYRGEMIGEGVTE